MSNIQVRTALAPHQTVMVPFNNIYTAGFQSVTFQNLTSVINASNPTGAPQTVRLAHGLAEPHAIIHHCADLIHAASVRWPSGVLHVRRL